MVGDAAGTSRPPMAGPAARTTGPRRRAGGPCTAWRPTWRCSPPASPAPAPRSAGCSPGRRWGRWPPRSGAGPDALRLEIEGYWLDLRDGREYERLRRRPAAAPAAPAGGGRAVTAPGSAALAALAVALRDLEEQTAALAAGFGALAESERGERAAAPWGGAGGDLAARVLPLSLKDPGTGPVARRLLALERRQQRLVREGASLGAQSEALRRYLGSCTGGSGRGRGQCAPGVAGGAAGAPRTPGRLERPARPVRARAAPPGPVAGVGAGRWGPTS